MSAEYFPTTLNHCGRCELGELPGASSEEEEQHEARLVNIRLNVRLAHPVIRDALQEAAGKIRLVDPLVMFCVDRCAEVIAGGGCPFFYAEGEDSGLVSVRHKGEEYPRHFTVVN